jgi:4-hydroxy-tetrahydrodipicolinate synthase
MNCTWRGVFPAVTTQFHADHSLDVPATLRHIDALLEAGIDGLIMLGTVGENCSLEYAEKLDLLRAVAGHVARRVPVLTGVAELTTRLACRFARDAAEIGIDGLMVLPAIGYKADAQEALAHFHAVARCTDLPNMIYNNPVVYGVDVTPEMFSELAEERTVVAIKESSDNVRRVTDLKNAYHDRFVLFCGVDDLLLESVLLGAQGWVSGLVNAFPQENRRLWQMATGGHWQAALDLYRWYTPLLHLDTRVKLVQCIKLAMQVRGMGTETVRPPRLPLSGAEREAVLKIIDQALATRPSL